jgi:hypothetical protein
MEEWIALFHSSRQVDWKIYMDRLVWNPNELITIFGRFSTSDVQENRPSWFLRPSSDLTRVLTRFGRGFDLLSDKTTPILINIKGPWLIDVSSTNNWSKTNLLLSLFALISLPTPCCYSSLNATTKDDTLGLLADLRQSGDVLTSTGFLLGESFDGSFASLPGN